MWKKYTLMEHLSKLNACGAYNEWEFMNALLVGPSSKAIH